MSRKISLAALAAALVATCFVGGPAEASNMGFKLERDFEVVPGNKNVYMLAFPLYNGLGDVGGPDMDGDGDPCNEAADGFVTVHDLFCHLWSGRGDGTGQFTVATYLPSGAGCGLQNGTLIDTGGGTFFATGPLVDFPAADIARWDVTTGDFGVTAVPGFAAQTGYQVIVSGTGGTANSAVIVGSHNPAITTQHVGLDLDGDGNSCFFQFLNVPYHTMFTEALEVLCGLKGTDWDDADLSGTPDTCPNGVWDCNSQVSVTRFFNLPGENRQDGPTALNLVDDTCVEANMFLTGTNFQLTPGESVIVSLTSGFSAGGRDFQLYHF